MEIIAKRLRLLRTGAELSQAQIASQLEMTQTSINRYENGQATPPPKVLLWYADTFRVSMDYLYGRIDQPQGCLYPATTPVEASEEVQQFIEMCFDPNSPMQGRLKSTLARMLEEGKE